MQGNTPPRRFLAGGAVAGAAPDAVGPPVLAVWHLPPRKPHRCVHQDRLVLAIAGYGNRPLPVAVVTDRAAAWLDLSRKAVLGSLHRLAGEGAIALGDEVKVLATYKARARREGELFRFQRDDVQAFARRELEPLGLALLGVLPTRSKDGTWADSHGHLATMLGASRPRVQMALASLARDGRIEQVGTFRLPRRGAVLTSWWPVGVPRQTVVERVLRIVPTTFPTETLERPTETPAFPTGTQSETPFGRFQDLRVSETPAAADQQVETGVRQGEAEPAPTTDDERQRHVEAWTLGVVQRGIEVLDHDNQVHVGAVADLLNRLDPLTSARFARDRLRFARRLCAWSWHSETLGRWLVRVMQRRGPDRLLAYLRTASRAGDPGTVLHSETKNELGRGAEQMQVMTTATEAALEGPYAAAVAQIVAGGAEVLSAVEAATRDRLRAELRVLLAAGKPEAAGRVLRFAFRGQQPTDRDLEQWLDGAVPVAVARRLLAVA